MAIRGRPLRSVAAAWKLPGVFWLDPLNLPSNGAALATFDFKLSYIERLARPDSFRGDEFGRKGRQIHDPAVKSRKHDLIGIAGFLGYGNSSAGGVLPVQPSAEY